ncbi:MAG TPA: amidohydrolase family protein [Pseudonocardia sp.]|jgi:predicted TIM-barrel fold metal-dependent hydrolase|nr:amidohydrolase family protein [Pseudonocardia sp.]
MGTRIDVHTHFVPDFYREALIAAGHEHPDGIAAIPAWDEQRALDTMDELGIDTAVLSISSPGVHFGDDVAAAELSRRVNDEAARLAAAHPGRFGFFATLPVPDVPAALVELDRAMGELGAVGAVLETNHHGQYLGDPGLGVLHAELASRGGVLFVHPTAPYCGRELALGYPFPMLEFLFETTRSITNLVVSGALARNPGLKVIVPHAGATLPVLANRIDLLLPVLGKPGMPTPPSMKEALRTLYFDLAGAPVPELLGALLEVADHGHILYGSDWPFTPTAVCADLAERIDTTPLLAGPLRTAVLSGNAARLFPNLVAAARS